MKPMPSVERFREVLRYDAETGRLFWRAYSTATPQWLGQYAGKEGFLHIGKDGYRIGAVDHRSMPAHRAIWIIVHGIIPVEIDHINGDRLDNRLVNLRQVSRAENGRNQKMLCTNKSGATGVYWHKPSQKWLAQIRFDGKRMHLGLFSELAQAADAHRTKALELGFHPNHGRRTTIASTLDGDG